MGPCDGIGAAALSGGSCRRKASARPAWPRRGSSVRLWIMLRDQITYEEFVAGVNGGRHDRSGPCGKAGGNMVLAVSDRPLVIRLPASL
jgi:hypothetical protein